MTQQLDLSKGQGICWQDGRGPPKDRTLQQFEHSHVNLAIYASLAATASCGIIMAAVFLAINIKYRNQRYSTHFHMLYLDRLGHVRARVTQLLLTFPTRKVLYRTHTRGAHIRRCFTSTIRRPQCVDKQLPYFISDFIMFYL